MQRRPRKGRSTASRISSVRARIALSSYGQSWLKHTVTTTAKGLHRVILWAKEQKISTFSPLPSSQHVPTAQPCYLETDIAISVPAPNAQFPLKLSSQKGFSIGLGKYVPQASNRCMSALQGERGMESAQMSERLITLFCTCFLYQKPVAKWELTGNGIWLASWSQHWIQNPCIRSRIPLSLNFFFKNKRTL